MGKFCSKCCNTYKDDGPYKLLFMRNAEGDLTSAFFKAEICESTNSWFHKFETSVSSMTQNKHAFFLITSRASCATKAQ